MPAYDAILDSQVDSESPLTESLMTQLRDNPEMVHSGDATVPSLKRILVPNALRTNEVDTSSTLVPDGLGGVRWIGGGFAGAELNGTGLGSPIADLNAGGVFHFDDLTISVAQTPTAPLTIYCSGSYTQTASITSSYPIRIFCVGNVALGVITSRGLEVRCGGNLTVGGAINASSGVTRRGEAGGLGKIGVVRFFCAGNLSASTYAITGCDILVYAGGTVTASGAWTARWLASAGTQATIGDYNGASWSNANGVAASSGGEGYDGASVNGGAGGGGGSGGGAGGGPGGGQVGAPGVADGYRNAIQVYLLAQAELRRGSGGGSNVTPAGGDGGGRVSVFAVGNINFTGATLSANGVGGGTGTGVDDGGGGGGGVVRVVSIGSITAGTYTANGGSGGSAYGGGGGGGGAFLLGSSLVGGYSVAASGGTSTSGTAGQAGTGATSAATALEVTTLAASGIFNA